MLQRSGLLLYQVLLQYIKQSFETLCSLTAPKDVCSANVMHLNIFLKLFNRPPKNFEIDTIR